MLLIEWRNESGGRHLVTQISEADMRLRDHVRPRLCGIPLFFAIYDDGQVVLWPSPPTERVMEWAKARSD